MSNCGCCQYHRDRMWCSNSKSPKFKSATSKADKCDEFSERGKKAPAPLLAFNKALHWWNSRPPRDPNKPWLIVRLMARLLAFLEKLEKK